MACNRAVYWPWQLSGSISFWVIIWMTFYERFQMSCNILLLCFLYVFCFRCVNFVDYILFLFMSLFVNVYEMTCHWLSFVYLLLLLGVVQVSKGHVGGKRRRHSGIHRNCDQEIQPFFCFCFHRKLINYFFFYVIFLVWIWIRNQNMLQR